MVLALQYCILQLLCYLRIRNIYVLLENQVEINLLMWNLYSLIAPILLGVMVTCPLLLQSWYNRKYQSKPGELKLFERPHVYTPSESQAHV